MNGIVKNRARQLMLIGLLVAVGCAGQEGVPGGGAKAVEGSPRRSYAEQGGWIQTGGPSGGYINDLAQDPRDPDRLYAAGSPLGLYTSIDKGQSWSLLPFPAGNPGEEIEVDPFRPDTLYCTFANFSRSDDRGRSWHPIDRDFREWGYVKAFALHPKTPGVLYAAVHRFGQNRAKLLMSEDRGESWKDISPKPVDREGVSIEALAWSDGRIFTALNYGDEQQQYGGKLYAAEENGASWRELSFGQREKRFIFSVFANPYVAGEVWLSEGPLYNEGISQPMIYRSLDNGRSWSPVYLRNVRFDSTQVRLIGAGADGRIYVAAGAELLCTADGGQTFEEITPDRTMMEVVDYRHILVDSGEPGELLLPLRATGIAHSVDGGRSWELRHEGIVATHINLLAVDPRDTARVYAAGTSGVGTFRSDDHGATWVRLNAGGILHSFGDELQLDPGDPNTVWFITDVPYIHRSRDRGRSWEVLANPRRAGDLSFNSIYALAPTVDPNRMYAVNNGFGIYRGDRQSHGWHWDFLQLSGVDYTYSIAASPHDWNTVYSGYSCKPFERSAKIRVSRDGGESWSTCLEIEGAEAVTSVAVDPARRRRVFASSAGEDGVAVWWSDNEGRSWQKTNPYFNFCTIHSYAAASDGTAYAGLWGGGTYKTEDGGRSWRPLSDRRIFSTAAIAVDPSDGRILYAADRTRPVVYQSQDGGEVWSEYFDAGSSYVRLMHVAVDPHRADTIYVSAMRPGHAGRLGSLFRVHRGKPVDITGTLDKVPLTCSPDPGQPGVLYAVLHESGVYRSGDGGSSWRNISGEEHGLPASGFSGLYVHPDDSRILYLVGGCDVRFETFESAGMDPDVVNGVYRSTDSGESWRQLGRGVLGRGSGAIKGLAFSSRGFLYVAAENGAFFSVDQGATWDRIRELPFETLGGLAVQSDDVERIYAFTNGAGLFTGTILSDGNVRWDRNPRGQVLQRLHTRIYFTQVIKDPRPNDVLYASGYPGGIFKSDDGGRQWHEANFGVVSFDVEDPLRQGYYALAISPSDPDNLYLGLYGKGIYRSVNGASTWYPVNGLRGEMAGKYITALLIDSRDPETVYTAAEDGVYRTTDGGGTWRSISEGLTCREIRTLCQNADGEIFAGSKGYGIFQRRKDDWQTMQPFGQWGVIWPIWDDRPLYQYTSLLIHPENSRRVMIGTFPQGIYISEDAGAHWRESNIGWSTDGVFRLVSHPEEPAIVYAGTYNGINRSGDFGGHWEVADIGWPDEQWVFSIDFDPRDPSIMYACSKNGEEEGRGREGFRGIVMKSTDNGDNWFEITGGLESDQEFYEILVDRHDSRILYLAAQRQGVMISTDAGASWRSWNQGLPIKRPATNGNNVTRCLVISADGEQLYFGSAGAGVYRRKRLQR